MGEYEATVSVVWNGDHYVGSLPVTLYKCDILGSHRDHADCSLCVTRAKKYRCAWCGSVCAYSESCPLSAASECPRPRIDVVLFPFPPFFLRSLSLSPSFSLCGRVFLGKMTTPVIYFERATERKIEIRLAVDSARTATSDEPPFTRL